MRTSRPETRLSAYDADRNATAIRVTARKSKSKHASLPRPPRELQHLPVLQV